MFSGINTQPSFWGNLKSGLKENGVGMLNSLSQQYGSTGMQGAARMAGNMYGNWKKQGGQGKFRGGGLKSRPIQPKNPTPMPTGPTGSQMPMGQPSGGLVTMPNTSFLNPNIRTFNSREIGATPPGLMGSIGMEQGTPPPQYPTQPSRGLWDRYNMFNGMNRGAMY